MMKPVARRLLGQALPTDIRTSVRQLVLGGRGLEIGGPSSTFRHGGALPIYPFAATIDNCNFASATVWEGAIATGMSFVFDDAKAPGMQYICEATAVDGAVDGHYDFVLSSHTIEHTANPLAAIRAWRNVLREGGTLVMLVPHHQGTFDHRRPLTTLGHLLEDERRGVGEDDTTHLDEIIALHDLSRDPGAGSADAFRQRCAENAAYRCVHHHVFDTALVASIADAMDFQIEHLAAVKPHHIVLIARKRARASIDNARFLQPGHRAFSPFSRDRARQR